ncbi:hypothetical protein Q9233_013560 [Columba guinea]|nr:hypothetical protein Q9233_013560 [Columba guinea]
MSERRRSAVALSSRAHAFSVEALIGTNKKRKLRDWEDKGLDLSMESLSPNGQLGDNEDPTQCLDLNPAMLTNHSRALQREKTSRRILRPTTCLLQMLIHKIKIRYLDKTFRS